MEHKQSKRMKDLMKTLFLFMILTSCVLGMESIDDDQILDFPQENHQEDQDALKECSICHDKFSHAQNVVETDCHHRYCTQCFLENFMVHGKYVCAMCRQPVGMCKVLLKNLSLHPQKIDKNVLKQYPLLLNRLWDCYQEENDINVSDEILNEFFYTYIHRQWMYYVYKHPGKFLYHSYYTLSALYTQLKTQNILPTHFTKSEFQLTLFKVLMKEKILHVLIRKNPVLHQLHQPDSMLKLILSLYKDNKEKFMKLISQKDSEMDLIDLLLRESYGPRVIEYMLKQINDLQTKNDYENRIFKQVLDMNFVNEGAHGNMPNFLWILDMFDLFKSEQNKLVALISQEDELGNSGLHNLIKFQKNAFLDYLILDDYLDKSVIQNALTLKNKNGDTPLHSLCRYQIRTKSYADKIFDMIHELFVDDTESLRKIILTQNQDGNTPLHFAISPKQDGDGMIEKILVNKIVKIFDKLDDSEGKMFLDLLQMEGLTNQNIYMNPMQVAEFYGDAVISKFLSKKWNKAKKYYDMKNKILKLEEENLKLKVQILTSGGVVQITENNEEENIVHKQEKPLLALMDDPDKNGDSLVLTDVLNENTEALLL